MSDLPPELETLIEHARDGHAPDPYAKTRVRAALATSIVAGATVAATTATAKGLSPVVLSLLLAGGGVAVVSVAAVTLDWRASQQDTPRAPSAPPRHTGDENNARPAHREGADELPTPAAVVPIEHTIETHTPATPRSHPPRPHHVTQPAFDPVSTLADELDLVRRATAAINEQRWAQAIDWLDQHASRYPQGALAQERSGLRALSLCKLGHADGKNAAARFVRTYPDSPMIERLRASCAEVP